MKLIIDIDEKLYNAIKGQAKEGIANRLKICIANGIPYEKKPQGEWILEETDCDDGGNNLYKCNICHYSDIHSGSIEVPYCWHCGSDMKEAEK